LAERGREALGLGAAAALGVVAFFVWAGWTYLDPQNVSWVRTGDRAMHTLGWWFFRVSPWGFPPGINPRNGLEISSSIALSDSLPLFAIPFKLLSPLLPTVFQYWGIWFLTCMILQGVFGYLIGRALALTRPVSVLLGACLILFPAFVWRLPVHMALAGHWTLLWALWLYVGRRPPRPWAWPLLLGVTASVHAYLVAMVLAIWAAALVQRVWVGTLSRRGAALELAAGLAATVAVMWLVGFFMTPSLGAKGFGFYRMNLDSFLDPNKWSLVLPNLPSTAGDYEGQSFPGLGILVLLVLGLVLAFPRLRAIWSPRWLPLLGVAFALGLFAMSDKPVLGSWELGTIPLPPAALDFASMFRASGRMIWPAAYLAVLLAFVLLAGRLRPRVLAGLAAAAVLVQAVDTSRGWSEFANIQPPPAATWPTPIHSPFWEFAARHYDKLRAIPVMALNPEWAELSYFAAFHGMGSDAAYLGRRDEAGFERLEGMADAALSTGAFEPDALYVLDPAAALRTRTFMRPEDMLVGVDGFIVFGRNGKTYAAEDGVTLPQALPLGPVPAGVGAAPAAERG
jgi:hypothetical protein